MLGGLAAQAFIWLLELGERLFLMGIAGYVPPAVGAVHPEPRFGPWTLWLIPLSTTLGGLLSGLIVYSLAPEAEGHGTDAAIASYHFRGSKVRPIVPLIKAIASAITIGSGGAAGREGPAAQIGSGATAILCDILRVPVAERRLLVLSGMAAGLAAIFRAPLGMAIFAAEILYAGLAFEFEVLPYSLVAAVVAYAVNGLFVGWVPLFALPSTLQFTAPVELVGFAILGVLAGLVGAIEPSIFYGIRDLFHRLAVPRHLKPAIGGLLMGCVAAAFPPVLATGFGWVQMALTDNFIGHYLIVLVFAKILAMSLTISSGGSGGVFGPNVFIGGLLGGWTAYVVYGWLPSAAVFPAAYVVVGMGAVFGGTARVPLSTLIMVVEMTGGYGLIVPAMLATSLSLIVQTALGSRLPYPRLYEAQVEGRPDSPVHYRRLVESAFQILESQRNPSFGRVSLPGLDRLLRHGGSIAIHQGKGRLFGYGLDSGKEGLVGRSPAEVFGPASNLAIVAVVRGHEVMGREQVERFMPEDFLLLAGSDEAEEAFIRVHGHEWVQPGTD
ncbi:MAG TPA: chloride channel protein [Candidatus Methylomirabilis sp.]|nr:chloride channel protein [Candidatus Methylomirabilis sp.]